MGTRGERGSSLKKPEWLPKGPVVTQDQEMDQSPGGLRMPKDPGHQLRPCGVLCGTRRTQKGSWARGLTLSHTSALTAPPGEERGRGVSAEVWGAGEIGSVRSRGTEISPEKREAKPQRMWGNSEDPRENQTGAQRWRDTVIPSAQRLDQADLYSLRLSVRIKSRAVSTWLRTQWPSGTSKGSLRTGPVT